MSTRYSERPQDAQRLRLQAIVDALADCTLAYPGSGVTEEQVMGMAALWLEDLAHFSPEVITRAIRRHRRTSRWFPSIADAIAACKAIAEFDASRRLALPEPHLPFEEQMAFNREQARAWLNRQRERERGTERRDQ